MDKFSNRYIVNKNTLAIFYNHDPLYITKILEPDQTIYCTRTALKVLEDSCIEGGASLAGRKEVMKRVLRTRTKLPIPVNPKMGIYMFPTKSHLNIECNWISFFHVSGYWSSTDKKDHLEIQFTNGSKHTIASSYTSFQKQMLKTGLAVAYYCRNDFWPDDGLTLY
ncbi:competence protein ComK [Melghiribacillus thermohalophilus]|uniref:Competence protein ComK n=1 Tax=Melghiribacillus thermohalophilus TaxID=1324956 RepID=A0A4R3NC79_9BACI|nr:competence protein ComK [Melghiribacillus thermohalophilus]TCT26438.1 competence protein ComK [Melghiribacillus thermohalophilus]